MKKLRNVLLLLLIAAMALAMFSGCESEADKIEELAGIWSMVVDDTEEEAMGLLEFIDLYEEEIALVDLTALDYVQTVEFSTGKNYRFGYDIEGTRNCVYEYYVGVFEALYEGRATLNEVYGVEFDQMTQAEFEQFYAELYEYSDFTEMLGDFADQAYDYEMLAEDLETGTYSIKGDEIHCSIDGVEEAEYIVYEIAGSTLTLTYIDGVEVYTRVG